MWVGSSGMETVTDDGLGRRTPPHGGILTPNLLFCAQAGLMIQMMAMSESAQIDAKIKALGDWRGQMLSQLRALINRADHDVVEEVKWKKPSNPSGVPVWSHDGIICIGEPLKSAVRLTFPKGASIKDPKKLFNARLDSNSVRAIDFREGDAVDDAALKALILEGVRLNVAKAAKK